MPPEIVAVATIITIVAGTLALIEFVWKPFRRLVLKRTDSDPVTQDQFEEVKRMLEEFKEQFAPSQPPAVDVGTDQLAKAADQETKERLGKALETRSSGETRDLIDRLYQAFRVDLPSPAKAQLHGLLGNSFLGLRELEEAEGHYLQALDASRAARLRDVEASILGNIGVVYAERGDARRSMDYHNQALAIAYERGTQKEQAYQLGNLANVLSELGEGHVAKSYIIEVIAISRRINDKVSEAGGWATLAGLEANEGNPTMAKKHFELSLRLFETDQEPGVAVVLTNLASLHRTEGDVDTAIALHERAGFLFRQLGDRTGEAKALSSLGLDHYALQRLPAAEKCFAQALTLNRDVGNRLGEGLTLGNLANVYVDTNRLDLAGDTFRASLGILREIGNPEGEAGTLVGLGGLRARQGNRPDAKKHVSEALTIQRKIGHRSGEAASLGNLGLLTAQEEDGHDEACQLLQSALHIYDEIGEAGRGPDIVRAKLAELGCD